MRMRQHSHWIALFSGYVDFDRVLGSKTVHGDFNHWQIGITTEAAALNTDMGSAGRTIYSPDWDWFGWLVGMRGSSGVGPHHLAVR
jgi:hypothetical protein